MFIDCEKTAPKQIYEILVNAVVPRPIAWVSTRGKNGVSNLAPFSFFNVFSANPPVLGFSPGLKRAADGKAVLKDTLQNVLDTEEFVVNIVSGPFAEKMVKTSANFSADVSEFDAVGLSAADSLYVTPPRVLESPINLECKLFKIVEIGSSNLVLGRIVCIHIDNSVITDGQIDVLKLQPVARLGGEWYSIADDPFVIERP